VVLSLSLAGAFTQVVKMTAGRPRPGEAGLSFAHSRLTNSSPVDVLDRCHPDPSTVDPPFGLSSVEICHQSDSSILNDGFMSFPSGHSSCAIFFEPCKPNRCADISFSILCWAGFLIPVYCREVAFIRLARTCGASLIKSISRVRWFG
jgi:hypothetical protein